MKIGIVGNGFVGSSVAFGFSPNTGCDVEHVKIYDKDKARRTHELEEVINTSDYIFLSVPTPSNSDGSISLDIIYDVFEEIHNVIDYTKPGDSCDTQPIILLRSTVTPGTTREIQKKYPLMRLVFNPEFLTERSAKLDFINQSRFVLGGSWGATTKKRVDLGSLCHIEHETTPPFFVAPQLRRVPKIRYDVSDRKPAQTRQKKIEKRFPALQSGLC